MQNKAAKKAEKRVCQICYEPVSCKQKCRSHCNAEGIKCNARICKTCMSKALQTDDRCPFCRKELPMKKMAIVKDVDNEVRVHIFNTFLTLLREGGAEDAMGYLDYVERQIENNYKKLIVKKQEFFLQKDHHGFI